MMGDGRYVIVINKSSSNTIGAVVVGGVEEEDMVGAACHYGGSGVSIYRRSSLVECELQHAF